MKHAAETGRDSTKDMVANLDVPVGWENVQEEFWMPEQHHVALFCNLWLMELWIFFCKYFDMKGCYATQCNSLLKYKK